ncbi:helix-turn-helix transcriptional regulator [Actinospongicola halichondriae]|uniref:helix-turn-helix transcriptional regulator n=1 Tax=Actinospongicola halichondriae TaxID=3236844 RepID=UPI003D39F5C4
MAATPKLERLLDLIAELLHTERPLSAEDLHERLPGYPEDRDSFKRAFERDKADLREMDIPLRVETIPGIHPPRDGYRIDQDEYGLADPGLEADELAAIHLAATAVRLDGANPHPGLHKLGGAVVDEDPERGSAVLPSAPNLAEVFEAVGQHRQLRFRYRDKDRVVDPFRLHHERGHWYVQGHDHDAGESRSFRLDRVEGPLDVGAPDSIEVVVDVDANPIRLDAWALGDDPPVAATVRVDPPQAALAARVVGASADSAWDDDGSVLLRLDVRHREGFRNFVLSFLDGAEVLEPQELRDEIVEWLQALGAGERR